MGIYLGDWPTGSILDLKFNTVNTSAVPTTLAGSPVIGVYASNSTAATTTGVTLTTDFGALTGCNHVRIDTTVPSASTFYIAQQDYQVIIGTGTVGGTSVVGVPVGHFSIDNRGQLRPTTPTRTLGVNASGQAGIDWANVGGASTAVNLTSTRIASVNNPVSMNWASLSSPGATNALTGTSIASVNNPVSLNWASLSSPGATNLLTGTQIATVSTVTAVNDKTGYSIGAGGITAASFAANALTAAAINTDAIGYAQFASATGSKIGLNILDCNLASASDVGTNAYRTILQALRMLRNKVSVPTGALTVTKEDDATTSWTGTIATDTAANAGIITTQDPT